MNKKNDIMIEIIEDSPPTDPLLAQVLQIVIDYPKKKKVYKIVELLNKYHSDFFPQLINRLVEHGFIKKIEKKRLLIFKELQFSLTQSSIMSEIYDTLQEINSSIQSTSIHAISLLTLIKATKLRQNLFNQHNILFSNSDFTELLQTDMLAYYLNRFLEASEWGDLAVRVITS
ncbi:GPP34 family phosphoprotein [Candidatus Lokiarchaeum ossiferum]|uniref:GPP34 family phosphoprotein n=1 Tax=Candidatus Lokiarchaeum ossiferum TaxID=2951803 RepID=UPI00352CECA1